MRFIPSNISPVTVTRLGLPICAAGLLTADGDPLLPKTAALGGVVSDSLATVDGPTDAAPDNQISFLVKSIHKFGQNIPF